VSDPCAAAVLERVRAEVRALGGSLPELDRALDGDVGSAPSDGAPQLAASGPRIAGERDEYELLLELIREGYLLHYGRARVVDGLDRELALILGDGLYARGLARLAALGDLEAVAELGDLISLVAQAEARRDSELSEALWTASAVAIGWGSDDGVRAAQEQARQERPEAARSLREAAARRRSAVPIPTSDDAPAREGGNL
jgi:hypothetical protein